MKTGEGDLRSKEVADQVGAQNQAAAKGLRLQCPTTEAIVKVVVGLALLRFHKAPDGLSPEVHLDLNPGHLL